MLAMRFSTLSGYLVSALRESTQANIDYAIITTEVIKASDDKQKYLIVNCRGFCSLQGF